MSTEPLLPPLDVMAVLADLQQQLTDLTGIVQAQQRTLQHLLDDQDRPVTVTAAVTGAPTGTAAVAPPGQRRP